MSINQIQIKVQDLILGMYVSRLDRPWSQTPYPLQGFYVRTPEDIENLKSFCVHVYIDTKKGRGPVNAEGLVALEPPARIKKQPPPLADSLAVSQFDRTTSPVKPVPSRPAPIEIHKGVYEITVPMRIEAAKAEKIVRTLKGQLTLASKQMLKGKAVNYPALKHVVEDMVGSVLRCPDAFTWLLRLRQKDQKTYDHTLRSALWAVQYARFIGMPREEITFLCLGALLKDVGKLRLPGALLAKHDKTPEEEAEYRNFVLYGVDMLRSAGCIEPKVISVVRYHCERLDGSGFPDGVAGNRIPMLARIVGIATVYDAISNPRESLEPVAPSRAVSFLYNMRNRDFQEDLVVTFIQSIGLYPTGTLVELTTGDLGVVLDQHPSSRLTPRIAVLDRWGEDLNQGFTIIDLKEQDDCRRLLLKSGHDNISNLDRIAIARDLEPTGYDIDFEKISSSVLGSPPQRAKKTGLLATLRQKLQG